MPPKGKGNMIIKRIREFRARNNKLWIELVCILEESGNHKYTCLIEQTETEIGWVAKSLSSPDCVYDLEYREANIAELERLRAENNGWWMTILRNAFKAQPDRCQQIMGKIADNDSEIQRLRRE